jgi:xanthine/CO dehydrogenase XdhC/CoxF family maturation factor
LIDAFTRWTRDGGPLVLATVVETSGSTYSKAGERMLLTGDGLFQGMLSGGCLEGDLAERAKQVIESGQPQIVYYDLRSDDDGIWGLGVGCDGAIRVLLQPLSARSGYEPFSAMVRALQGDEPAVTVTVVSSAIPELDLATTIVMGGAGSGQDPLPETLDASVSTEARRVRRTGNAALVDREYAGHTATLLLAPLRPPVRLLLAGAGLDAVPVVNLARELGWWVEVADHRPANFSGTRFESADRCYCDSVDALVATIDFARFDAIVVMTHHLETDQKFLEAIATEQVAYVGLLGPRSRRDRLLAALGDKGASLTTAIHGPAGIDIGARGPEAIALSILAEIQQELG